MDWLVGWYESDDRNGMPPTKTWDDVSEGLRVKDWEV